jgi:GNAT superfamily N-acetyltransferase
MGYLFKKDTQTVIIYEKLKTPLADGELEQLSSVYRCAMWSVVPHTVPAIAHLLRLLWASKVVQLLLLTSSLVALLYYGVICALAVLATMAFQISVLAWLLSALYVIWFNWKTDPLKHSKLYNSQQHLIIAARASGRIVGFAFMLRRCRGSKAGSSVDGYVKDMFVHPSHQRCGIGACLSNTLLEHVINLEPVTSLEFQTSSLQYGQIELQKQIANIVSQKVSDCSFEIDHRRRWWQPVYAIRYRYGTKNISAKSM